uniref:Plastid-encoded RNA polymerase subunit alpha n=1 Tax=Marsupiomonas sp. NIES 1824 TaxID=1562198 RepID=A0A097KLW1_9CHLO|nr:alpha subunit of RNA polymerase [Marsupiomonas sp. NIES 1824]
MAQTPFIVCVDSKIESPTSFYARFQIGPIPEGHGLTVGNALRRILLSEIKTFSIVAAKIQLGNGVFVPHEYSSLSGIRESTLDLLLNLKQIILTSNQDYEEPILGFLNLTGPTVVKAKDIQFSKEIKFIDPDQYIATINEECNLSIHLIAGFGKNGKSFLDLNLDQPGLFHLQPIFNPIHQINYKVESSLSPETDEKILLEMKTDGSIHPSDALKIGLSHLQELFNSLIFNPLRSFSGRIEDPTTKNRSEKFLGNGVNFTASLKKRLCSLDIANLNLEYSTYVDLKKNNLNTVGDLVFVKSNENLQKESIKEVTYLLAKLGLTDFEKKKLNKKNREKNYDKNHSRHRKAKICRSPGKVVDWRW